MLELFPMRLDPESVKTLEEIALRTGIAPSTLARNCLKVVLIPKEQSSLIDQAVLRAKKERKAEGNGTNEV